LSMPQLSLPAVEVRNTYKTLKSRPSTACGRMPEGTGGGGNEGTDSCGIACRIATQREEDGATDWLMLACIHYRAGIRYLEPDNCPRIALVSSAMHFCVGPVMLVCSLHASCNTTPKTW
jgi:hypothetical protein